MTTVQRFLHEPLSDEQKHKQEHLTVTFYLFRSYAHISYCLTQIKTMIASRLINMIFLKYITMSFLL